MRLLKNLHLLILLILSLMSLMIILSQVFYQQWLFDILAHFFTQYFIIFLIGIITLLTIKQYKLAIIFTPFFVYVTILIGHLYVGENKDTSLTESLKVSAVNVLSSNQNFQLLQDFIKKEKPDILILQEVTPIWIDQLKDDLQIFPYRFEQPQYDNFGIAFYSKIPLQNIEVEYFNDRKIPSIVSNFEWQNEWFTFVATHPVPPINTTYFGIRNEQFQRLSNYLNQFQTSKIVIGDLNTTSFSKHFRQFKKSTNLIDSRKGFGLQTTWRSLKPLVSLTLDHCLVSEKVKVKSRKVGDDIGSDHLPIVLEIGF